MSLSPEKQESRRQTQEKFEKRQEDTAVISGKREWELLEKIGFVRISGTEQELAAARMLAQEVQILGGEAKLEAFSVDMTDVSEASLTDGEREYPVSAYSFCESVQVTAPFYYMENKGVVDRQLAQGRIVLVNGRMNRALYEEVTQAGAVGFITFSGSVRDDYDEVDLDVRELRKPLRELGVIPGVHMKTHDAMELVRKNPKQLTLMVYEEARQGESHNVIAELTGDSHPEEVIVLTAHYDSVPFSNGVYDNGAGSVILMELYRLYREKGTSRTLRFVWCGSEERGLLGSKAYVAAHEEELKQVVLNINVDVAGAVLGHDEAMVTADVSLLHMIEYLSREKGFSTEIRHSICSSDCMPFADKGIPAVTFARAGLEGTSAYIHSRHDVMEYLSADSLERTTGFIVDFVDRLLSAVVFPIPRTMPPEMVEKIDEYLMKPKKHFTVV